MRRLSLATWGIIVFSMGFIVVLLISEFWELEWLVIHLPVADLHRYHSSGPKGKQMELWNRDCYACILELL